jgi:hypothetical protein
MKRKNLKRKVRRKLGKPSAAANTSPAMHLDEAALPRETRPLRHERGRQGFSLADR